MKKFTVLFLVVILTIVTSVLGQTVHPLQKAVDTVKARRADVAVVVTQLKRIVAEHDVKNVGDGLARHLESDFVRLEAELRLIQTLDKEFSVASDELFREAKQLVKQERPTDEAPTVMAAQKLFEETQIKEPVLRRPRQ